MKPPRNVLKKQAKYGTANDTPATVSSIKKKLTGVGGSGGSGGGSGGGGGGGGTNNATNIAMPPPPMSRFKTSSEYFVFIQVIRGFCILIFSSNSCIIVAFSVKQRKED